MAILAMKKIQIFAHKELRSQLLDFLQKQGVVQIQSSDDKTALEEQSLTPASVSYQEIEETLNILKHMVNFLQKHAQKVGARKIILDKHQWEQIVQHFNFQECYYKCRQIETELAALENKRHLLKNQLQQLEPWLNTDVYLETSSGSNYVEYLVGSIIQKKAAKFESELAEKLETVHYEIVSSHKQNIYMVLIVLKESREEALDILKRYDFNQIVFPKIKATPKQLYHRLSRELETVNKKIEQLLKETKELSQSVPKLLALIDYYQNLRENRFVQNYFLESRKTFIISGWIPSKAVESFQRELSHKFSEVEVVTSNPAPEDKPPVALENKQAIKPFEVVTELYGYPVYTGIDPTPYLSGFFALFFGICMSDVGYGFILVLGTGIILWRLKVKLTPNTRKFLKLFLIGGIVTMLAGAAMGSWFGVSTSFRLFDPLAQLNVFLGLSFLLGIIQVFTGIILRMWENIRDNGFWAGLWDQGSWIILIISLITLGFTKILNLSSTLATVSTFGAIVAAGFIVLFQARGADKNIKKDLDSYQLLYLGLTVSTALWILKIFYPVGLIATLTFVISIFYKGRKNIKGILARIGLGIFALYGITGYLGDVLSYSRLMALGLSGSIIAMVVNSIAKITMDLVPLVGGILAVFILIGGHLFNLVMNLLSAFVHTLRLQYVEFFTKFYSSGGKKFRPFGLEYKNVILAEKIME